MSAKSDILDILTLKNLTNYTLHSENNIMFLKTIHQRKECLPKLQKNNKKCQFNRKMKRNIKFDR